MVSVKRRCFASAELTHFQFCDEESTLLYHVDDGAHLTDGVWFDHTKRSETTYRI